MSRPSEPDTPVASRADETSTIRLPPPTRLGWISFWTALAYIGLGALGLAFAVGAGYASPIFPAAGLSLAVLLWTRGRAWPGVLAGSLSLNLALALWQGEFGPRAALVALVIAAGSLLQALAARALVERHVGDGWQTLERQRDVFRTLILGGPLACLIAATIGNATLYLAGITPAAALPYSAWNWWCGDTLGVVVALPLLLALLNRDRPLWRARISSVALPMALALAVVAAMLHAASTWEREQARAAVQGYGETLARVLDQRLVAHQEAIAALARLIEVTPEMNYAQFDYFTRITLKDNPDLYALSSDPLVTAKNRAAFEHELGARTALDRFQITEREPDGTLVRAGERPWYVPVAYIAPFAGNVAALGFDIASEPIRRDAIERARHSGEATATAPVQLVQQDRRGVGVLILEPARFHGEALTEQLPGLAGFAVGVLKVDELVEIATREVRRAGLEFELTDAAAGAGAAALYRSGLEGVVADETWQQPIRVADRAWTLKVAPTVDFLRHQGHGPTLLVGTGGLTLAALLQMLLLVASGRASMFERRVSEQNAELRHKTLALSDRNAQLDAVFSLSPDGFVVFAPDATVRFVNPAFAEMTGIVPAALLGAHEDVLLGELRQRAAQPATVPARAGEFLGDTATLVLERPRHVVLRVLGIDSGTPAVGRILYFHDVTHEVEVDRIKSEFLSHAAHELRTPLTIILGYSELLLSAERDAETRAELVDAIHRQAQALVGIINELLDLARIEARRGQDMEIVEVDLAQLVRSALADVVLPDARWTLALELPDGALHAHVDPGKFRQALMNVLSNAIKYSSEGGETRVEVMRAGGRIGVCVRDQGIGMSAGQLARYGERFWRADTSGRVAGTGLGVSIVKEILALMGGSLQVESRPGYGTTATLWVRSAGV